LSPKKLSACGISYKAVEAGTGRSAAGYLTFEREHLFVQTGMRFPESFIAFEPTSVAKARDDFRLRIRRLQSQSFRIEWA
jgi:hypothetical protein